MTAYDPFTFDVVIAVIPWAVAAAAVILAAVSAERTRMWRGRCAERDETIAALQGALDDGRLTMLRRRHPAAPVRPWAAPRRERPRRRRVGLTWPGDNTGHLSMRYGDPLDPDRVLATETETADYPAWLTQPAVGPQQYPPLSVQGLLVERLIADAQLEPQTWTAPTLQLQAVR